jgi:hypothetical protein
VVCFCLGLNVIAYYFLINGRSLDDLGNEHDLSSAQQMESQTKLRVETIEHEMSMETSRHAEAVAMLETKAKEIDGTTARALEMIDEKKAMIEAKKEELGKIWAVRLFQFLLVCRPCRFSCHF